MKKPYAYKGQKDLWYSSLKWKRWEVYREIIKYFYFFFVLYTSTAEPSHLHISPDTHILGFWIIFNTLNQQPLVCKFSTSRVTFHDCSSTKETVPSKLLTWSHQFEVKELTFCVHTERRRSEKCQQIGKGLSQLLRFILWPFWPFCLMPQNKLAVSWVI